MNLEKLIKEAFFDKPDNGMTITLYTGYMGMIYFDWIMRGIGNPMITPSFFHRVHRNPRMVIISLKEKHGMWKFIVKGRVVEVRCGGTLVKSCSNFEEAETIFKLMYENPS